MVFVGEAAVDQGGPRREFFRLLAKEFGSRYLVGREDCKFWLADVGALQVYIGVISFIVIPSALLRIGITTTWECTQLCPYYKEAADYPSWQSLCLIILVA